jgi:hypothetical protein
LALYAQEIAKLRRIIAIAEKLIVEHPKPMRGRPSSKNGNGKPAAKKPAKGKRIRRTGKKLVQFRRMLKAERRKGVSVAVLARKHHISAAYIYQLP